MRRFAMGIEAFAMTGAISSNFIRKAGHKSAAFTSKPAADQRCTSVPGSRRAGHDCVLDLPPG